MGQTPSEHPAQSDGLRDWLAAIAASQDELGRFLEGVLDRVGGLLDEFRRHQRAWESERDPAEQELRPRGNELTLREAELGTDRERLHAGAVVPRGLRIAVASAQEELIRHMAAELEQERQLEIVRCAAELSEMLSQQGRQMAEQREQWSDEVQRMTRLLDTVAQHQVAPPEAESRLASRGGGAALGCA